MSSVVDPVAMAYAAVHRAVRNGELPHPKTQACVDCKSAALHYDHRDYLRPLDVQPVCRACNRRRGKAGNGHLMPIEEYARMAFFPGGLPLSVRRRVNSVCTMPANRRHGVVYVDALKVAIELCDGQGKLARLLSTRERRVKRAHVWNWLHRDNRAPADQCIAIERVTNGQVTRYQLRPDVFGTSPEEATAE